MLFTCPNTACGKQYEIEPSQIPAGKAGFKCKNCGTLVPVRPAAPAADSSEADPQFVYQPKVTRRRTFSPALLGFLVVGVFLVGGSAAYFYVQYNSIANSGIVLNQNLTAQSMSDTQRSKLLDTVRNRKNP